MHRAVGDAHVGDEGRRRVRVTARSGPVDAARRHRAAVDEDVRIDRLHRVVGAREQVHVCRRGDVLAVRAELREPVAVEVRLVPDDVLADGREAPDEVGGELAELRPRRRRERRGAAADRHHRGNDPDVEEHAGRSDRLQRLQLVGRDGREALGPVRGDADRVEAGRLGQLQLGHRDLWVGVPALVLGRAHEHRRARPCRCRQHKRSEGAEERKKESYV